MGPLIWLLQVLFYFLLFQQITSSSSLSSFSSSATTHLCRHDERSALLQFKHMFTIDSDASFRCDDSGTRPRPKTMTWNDSATSDCCSWDGVMCDGLSGHVIGLDLGCSQLYGTIHPNSSLFQLSRLQRLNLAHNDFIDSRIPPMFGRFASLTYLNLSFSVFSGSIPSEISHLSKLISLDLTTYNRLRLEPRHLEMLLKNITQLQELFLYGVNISSVLPNSLMNLSYLTALDLSSTGLRGKLPENISSLPHLQRLFLGGNDDLNVNLSQARWNKGSSLKELDLSRTNLCGELPDSIGYLKSLSHLDLSETSLSGELPDSIGYLKSLNYLSLSYCKLWGPIPESLGNLTQISQLHLAANYFNGEVPYTLSNLKQLTRLSLSRNHLERKIPDVFAELTRLEVLDLGSNNLKGGFPPWVANLTQLVSLSIWSNALTGPILSNISGLQNLEGLDLSNNLLSGAIPSWLFTLPSLVILDLSYNRLTGQIPEFQHNSSGPIPHSILNLIELYLSSNKLSGVVNLQIFSRLKNLQILGISHNNLTVSTRINTNNSFPNLWSLGMSSCNIEEFPDFLRTSVNLEDLDLSENKIHGQIPNWIGDIGKASSFYLNLSHNFLTDVKELPWENLRSLDLRSNLLQGQLPVPPPSMVYFFISNNHLSGEVPLSICNASILEILDLSRNKLSGAIPPCLGNFSNVLSVSNLRGNNFRAAIPLTFLKHNNLRNLDLSGNHLEGPVPRSLTYCRSLEVLDLGNNKINDTFPYWLGTLPKLQVLVLRSNRFHGSIDASKTKFPFPMLRIVDLSHNKFTSHLPERYFRNLKAMKNTIPDQYIGGQEGYYHDSIVVAMKGQENELVQILTLFTTIDLSSNYFSGAIPNVIGRLNSLIVLNLSHNILTSHIPASLGDLISLESLDLSSNQFTGRIPSQLTSLTFLAALNLSRNHLQGPIPQGNQFSTFDNSSYIGNSGLCGFPVSKECGDPDHTQVVQPPVILQQEDDSDFASGFTWKVVAMGYGCGVALGLCIGCIMFLIGRPKFFVRLAEREKPKKVVRLKRTVWVAEEISKH